MLDADGSDRKRFDDSATWCIAVVADCTAPLPDHAFEDSCRHVIIVCPVDCDRGSASADEQVIAFAMYDAEYHDAVAVVGANLGELVDVVLAYIAYHAAKQWAWPRCTDPATCRW